MNGQITGHAILENVRRYRGIASLYRQTAAFRPDQSWSLLEQAKDWEARALLELEAYSPRGWTTPLHARPDR
ncbi:hypothetical protein [Bradyrhizobium sp. 172]|uniref:hypothetical protein n=1 Tax=Bradyrhizobium sp. 172 TaxID=2782643 RepID=UPI001FFEF7EF|nr:hypothetical protein [Bradyrhizobium sp. 172]UPJ94337.1 hypothetical protein IVB07_28130 [Bradyrhizobium sp. 172]